MPRGRGISINRLVLRELRRASGLTEIEAARRAGISSSLWSKYEYGQRAASQKTFDSICTALGVEDRDALRLDADLVKELLAEIDKHRKLRNGVY